MGSKDMSEMLGILKSNVPEDSSPEIARLKKTTEALSLLGEMKAKYPDPADAPVEEMHPVYAVLAGTLTDRMSNVRDLLDDCRKAMDGLLDIRMVHARGVELRALDATISSAKTILLIMHELSLRFDVLVNGALSKPSIAGALKEGLKK
jgi:hypothetical protein